MARCEREVTAFDDAVLRLKIGLDTPLTRENVNLLADDLANAATKFSVLGRCIGRTIARGR